MKLNTLIAAAIAGAFALPLAAQASADNDRMIVAQSGGPSGVSATGTGPTGGAPTPQSAGEPATQKDRAAGAGATSDSTTRCQGMIGTMRDDCMRDANRASSGATGTTTTSPSGSATTGATTGPDSASNKTAPSSATATSPDTSGQGKPK